MASHPHPSSGVTVLAIGAHPDDCDFGAAGLAALCVRAGHRVRFVAATNGDAGHTRWAGRRWPGGAMPRRKPPPP